MEIHELRAFLAVQAARSFSKGAQSLHITQPAMSRRIQSLEQSLEAKLFDRVGHDIFLTPQGQSLVPKAKAIVEAVDQLKNHVQNEEEVIKGDLNLLLSHHMAIYKMPPFLKEFMSLYPLVNIHFDFIASEEGCEKLRNNMGDLGLFTLPSTEEKDLQMIDLFQDPIRLVASKNHPLSKETHVSLERLASFRGILPPKASVTAAPFYQALARQSIQLQSVQESSVLETIKMLISIEAGWGILPASTLNEDFQEIHLEKPFAMLRSLGLVYNHKRTLTSPAKAMIKLIVEKTNKDISI